MKKIFYLSMHSQVRFLNYLKINQGIGLFFGHPFRTNFKVSRLHFIVFQNYVSMESISESFVSANASKKGKNSEKKRSSKQDIKASGPEDKEKKTKKSRKKKEPLLSMEKVNEMSNNLLQDLCQSKTLSEKFSLKPPIVVKNIDDIIESYKPGKNCLTNLEF